MIDAKMAHTAAENANRIYETYMNKFATIDENNIQDFKIFLFENIEQYSLLGHNSIEFQINSELNEEFLNIFKSLGFIVVFYHLDSTWSDKKFNLIISW